MNTSTTPVTFHLPVRPYSPIDALNRRAAALGSPRYAEASAHADYNGHHVALSWNSYRGYYIAEYSWSGRNVIARGDFAPCLAATLSEYSRGALGASASICPREDDEAAIALCKSTEELVANDIWKRDERGISLNAPWYTWRHKCAAASARDYAHPQSLAMVFDWALMQASETQEAYEAALKSKYGRVYQ